MGSEAGRPPNDGCHAVGRVEASRDAGGGLSVGLAGDHVDLVLVVVGPVHTALHELNAEREPRRP